MAAWHNSRSWLALVHRQMMIALNVFPGGKARRKRINDSTPSLVGPMYAQPAVMC